MSQLNNRTGRGAGFAALGIRSEYIEALAGRGITEPTAVQRAAIPPIAEGRDAIVHSGTGTGKTLAYVLPIIQGIDPDRRELQWLVIAPTQELAMQIVREIGFLIGADKVIGLIGGASLQRQLDKLKTRPAVAVGTTGRLIDLLKMRKLKLHNVARVVLDEADQLFASPSSSEEVDTVLQSLPKQRQLVFVTATATEAVRREAAERMDQPLLVQGESQAEATAAVSHQYSVCERRDKIDTIRRIIRTVNPAAALIFVKDSERIGELEAKLQYAGLPVQSLYSDAGKQERASVMQRFASGKLTLLIATDIAARGIDIPSLSHIINVEPPDGPEQYIHRAGRTGRMGREGTVITLVTQGERSRLLRVASKAGVVLSEMRLFRGKWEEAPAGGPSAERKKNAAGHAPQAGNKTSDRHPSSPSRSPQPAKRNRDRQRERERKNKGAPRWLKDKS